MSMTRFFEAPLLSPLKKQSKTYSVLSRTMEKQAINCLEKCGKLHAELEKIYGSCTDYSIVEKITDEYIKKIVNS